MFFVAALVICLVIKFRFPKGKSIASILRRDHQKNFLWASRLWVGRQKEPILGYVPKNDEKNNSVHKGLKALIQTP